jgi:hypothetical protein
MSERTIHSPGPWYIDRAHVRPTQNDLLAIYAANGDKLAVLTDDQSEEWRANAHVMAAAPELLVEAEEALALINQAADILAKNTYYKSNVVMARLRAAIAKARGEVE